MNKEKEPIIETEHIPTAEEVHAVFRGLIKGEYKEVRKREDEQGLYLLDVVVPGETEDEKTEYGYIREGQHKEQQMIMATEIYVVYYKNDIPIHGTSAARIVNGKWVIL